MSKQTDTCIGKYRNGVMYFVKPPCEHCQQVFKDIMKIGAPQAIEVK